ncbi:zeta toxin family protein [Bacteroidales bacterium OttesenSCG-928-B11]|nr:zeta toxin family protein [Bacteroidales bacterium OttesenSCG-928-E04]MDL2308177.1 zeta toxin family protein [Bacteroidales bacterium OttesenSCG-928-C03]MDL2312971.1 zeta toxin family protein [Bacteroidales bacterium OttesenSCG-928-B11]MDL2325616.1 zeta toxin family protein [Bacteroidales bacterium OttesenSCG-928-A14]
MKNMYIISGCNGAGKTTAAYYILPEILRCKEFVNADEIAKGLSPFQPEKVMYEAGRIMSTRISGLIERGENFAVETTLSAITYRKKVAEAQEQGYVVTLIYFWLNSTELAKQRVKLRVEEGGHNITTPVIIRRYYSGLKNFFEVFLPICDNVMMFDNSDNAPKLVMAKTKNQDAEVYNKEIYNQIYETYVRTRN